MPTPNKTQDWDYTLKFRELTLTDMYNMGLEDRDKYITKEAVWKQPDYQKLVNSGTLSRDAAYLLKQVYDAIPAKPADSDYIKNQSRWHEERKNYITFVAGIRDAMKHVRSADDIDKAFQSVMVANNFASDRGTLTMYRQSGARKVAQELLKGYDKIQTEAMQKMFCVPEKDQARMYFNVHCFIPERCAFKEVNGKSVLAVTDFDGERHYTVPKNSRGIDLNPESWKEKSFFLTRNGMIMHNNFDTLEEAQKAVDMFGKWAVQAAQARGTVITPSHRPAVAVSLEAPIFEIQQETPEVAPALEDTFTTPEIVEEAIFTDDIVAESIVEAPEEPATTSFGQEIISSLADALNAEAPAESANEPTVDPLEQFGFRNDSFYANLSDEQKQQVKENVVPAFETLHKALGLPVEAISMGGNLALTFDESPQKIAASYNVKTDTLNLAKLEGVDLLVNAWFSAMDLALGEQLGLMAPLSEHPYRDVQSVAPEFAKLMKTACVTQTPFGPCESKYHTASKDYDTSISDKSRYWQSMPILLSRAFACYITDKTGQSSQYLSGFSEKAGPVPEGLERKTLNKAFDAMIAEAKEIGIFTIEPEKEQVLTEDTRSSLEELIAQAGAVESGVAAGKQRDNREER